MAAIPERVWELLTEEEREQLRRIADGWRYEPRAQCPNCGCHFAMRLKITAGAVRLDEEGEPIKVTQPTASEARANKTASEDVALLLEAERSGVLAAFIEALRESGNAQDKANDLAAVFLHWFKLAKPKPMPRFAVQAAKERWGGRVSFFASNAVVAVVSDGVLKQFAPQRLLLGTKVPVLGGGSTRLVPESDGVLWLRGKHGYVPVDTPLFNAEMQKRSAGEFGRMVQ